MAVYTNIVEKEVVNHLKNYDLGNLIEFKGILAGIDNSNFLITTSKGRFILTIFESRISIKDLPFFINLKLHLAKRGVCCPRPIKDQDGQIISDIKGKKSTIVSFLDGQSLQPRQDGYYDNIRAKHCFELGEITARMHLAAADFPIMRKNDLGTLSFRAFLSKFEHLLGDSQPHLKTEIIDGIDFLENSWNEDLQKSAIHADLFPDNVFFDSNQKLSGVIDFYFAATDLLIYDFAIIVNAWCFDKNNAFSNENFIKMRQGYEKVRKINDDEDKFLKTALIAASMRFLLTRLYDKFFTPKDSLVKIKDPQEYLAKLRYFREKYEN